MYQNAPYTYRHPHPAVTTDVVLFTIREGELQLLLIQRANAPYSGMWALPGGFLEIDEDLEHCAKRELEEETGISGIYLEQLYTFGRPDRDPRERVISVTYYALTPSDRLTPKAAQRCQSDRLVPAQHPASAGLRPCRDHRPGPAAADRASSTTPPLPFSSWRRSSP